MWKEKKEGVAAKFMETSILGQSRVEVVEIMDAYDRFVNLKAEIVHVGDAFAAEDDAEIGEWLQPRVPSSKTRR